MLPDLLNEMRHTRREDANRFPSLTRAWLDPATRTIWRFDGTGRPVAVAAEEKTDPVAWSALTEIVRDHRAPAPEVVASRG